MTALVCTRNRSESIVQTVQSIFANARPDFELIVVDQSTDARTREVLGPFLSDHRLRYIPTETVGISRARNIGIAAAQADVIAITDDDCVVPGDWLEHVVAMFRDQPRVAVTFYNVEAAPHDAKLGFTPAYVRSGSLLVSTPRDKCKARGIGAGMAVRASAVRELGGFDEQLAACEEGDLAVRALLGGFQVYETDRVSVLHYGFRSFSQGAALSRRNWFGIGAAYAKPLKAGYWRSGMIPAYEFFVKALWPPVFDLLRLRRPRGLTGPVAFFQGFVNGLRTPINKETLCFQLRKN